MTDDVRTLSAELARDPSSLVFMALGELLRARGQLEAAGTVVAAGLARHPGLADAHDLQARIRADAGDLAGAEREWQVALEIDARHLGAHKGLGFVRFREGNVDAALEHLESALSVDPSDPTVVQALQNVRAAAQAAGEEPVPGPAGREGSAFTGGVAPVPSAPGAGRSGVAPVEPPVGAGRATAAVFAGLEGADQGMVLVDRHGRVLGGGIETGAGRDVSEAVAAHLTGVVQEAERTARMLELGAWTWIVAEATGGNIVVSQPAPGAALLLVRDRSVPSGRLAVLAEKATEVAQRWLGEQVL